MPGMCHRLQPELPSRFPLLRQLLAARCRRRRPGALAGSLRLFPLPEFALSLKFSDSFARLYDTGVLAHQGGWDEILLVAGPIAVIVLVLWQATRRADRQVVERKSLADSASTSGE